LRPRKLRLLVTVTLNHNQLRSHLDPILALDEVESVTLVADVPGPSLPKLQTVVPSRTLVRVLGRAAAKFVVCVGVARRERPNVVIAYNLIPHGLNAMAISRLFRIPAIFHMIGGPHEWLGGGWRSDNKVVGRLTHPSRVLEAILLSVIRRFEVVATMGPVGQRALLERGVASERVFELPAAVDTTRFRVRKNNSAFRYDVVSVMALIPRKRPGDVLKVLAQLHQDRPQLRAAILGKGPLRSDLEDEARRLGLGDAVDFVGFDPRLEEVISRSRVFLLASRQEGLSIAITEAMAAGVPPVVTRVGEAASLVIDGENGYLWDVGDIADAAWRVGQLLDDEDLRRRLGDAAARAAVERADFDTITERSRELLQRATST
jgi:glycosyltransferase involved in cell wall biosynthesis